MYNLSQPLEKNDAKGKKSWKREGQRCMAYLQIVGRVRMAL